MGIKIPWPMLQKAEKHSSILETKPKKKIEINPKISAITRNVNGQFSLVEEQRL